MSELEERMAHMARMLDDLSDVVRHQQDEIDALTRRVRMLMMREGEREADAGSGVVLGDEAPPPHW